MKNINLKHHTEFKIKTNTPEQWRPKLSVTLTRTPAAMEAIVLRFSPQSMHSEHLKPSRNPDIFSGHLKKTKKNS